MKIITFYCRVPCAGIRSVCILILCLVYGMAGTAEADQEQLAIEEQFEQAIEQARVRIEELEEILAERRAARPRYPMYLSIEQLKLPQETPTKQEVGAFVDAIIVRTLGRYIYSADSAAGLRLQTIGVDNLDVLLQKIKEHKRQSMGLVAVLELMATEEHKNLVISSLGEVPYLVRIIHSKKWHLDAKAYLLDGLRRRPRELKSMWLECIVLLQDASCIPELKWRLVHSQWRVSTYNKIKAIPGINLKPEIAEIWKDMSVINPRDRAEVLMMVAGFGYTDALDQLMSELHGPNGVDDVWDLRRFFNEHIENDLSEKSSIEEMEAWYGVNKDKLLYDETHMKYLGLGKRPASAVKAKTKVGGGNADDF